jgi:hypothetical protein
VVRPIGVAPAERMTVKTAWVKPADLMSMPTTVPDKLVEAGVLSRSERRALLAQQRELLKPAARKHGVRKGVTRVADGARVPSNFGGGQLAYEHRIICR